MNTYQKSTEYKPVQAIIAYRSEDDKYYLESQNIIQKSGAYLLQEAKPLQFETIQKLVNGIAKANRNSIQSNGIFNPNILYVHQQGMNNTIMWFCPAMKHHLYFAKDLNIPSGIAHCPPLLFLLNKDELKVFALMENTRPSNNSKLYRAPFYNIYETGSVCLGNAKLPSKQIHNLDELIQAWEKVFWCSVFTHIIGENPVKGNLNTIYKQLIKTGEEFPLTELKEHHYKTVLNLFKHIK